MKLSYSVKRHSLDILAHLTPTANRVLVAAKHKAARKAGEFSRFVSSLIPIFSLKQCLNLLSRQ